MTQAAQSIDITIGKPIANTQIYILDNYLRIVPIGVPGELCIAGDGVGLGYLNRPDLTAERFLQNPFATEENHHGKTLYRTGDLACWREDGKIEYLGRIDTQVKIRGLRIELGEIESVMSSFPGIQMCAVADKKDASGRQYLVGYYNTTSDTRDVGDPMIAVHIDEKALRAHLAAKLPAYMVPNFFVHLKTFPMTPSGKLDRKNLPEAVDIYTQEEAYVEPQTALQKTLCAIAGELLGVEHYGICHNFFDNGGDSLRAIEYIVRLESEGLSVRLQMVFDNPTPEQLAQAIEEGEHWQEDYRPERFEKYMPFFANNQKAPSYDLKKQEIKRVFLTGITGFLGAHILDTLLRAEKDCVVYCLVRSISQEDRRGRFPQMLEYYFGDRYTAQIGKRIIPVVGDITREDLADDLPEQVDLVIHAAATVKHFGKYDYFYEINTLGTKHVAEYALRVDAGFLDISTISVSGNSLADSFETEIAVQERDFTEASLYQEQSLANVYVRSKFEAECAVLDLVGRGLRANIVRVGNLTNRAEDFKFQPNFTENAFLSRVKSALELGCMPDYLLPLYSEFSPVDDTARAIVKIAQHFNQTYTVFHVNSNRNLYFDRLVEILHSLDIPMEVVSDAVFSKRLRDVMKTEQSYIYEAFVNDLDENGRLAYDSHIHIKNDFTLSYLKQLGFTWTEIDIDYIRGYLDYFREIGYLKI